MLTGARYYDGLSLKLFGIIISLSPTDHLFEKKTFASRTNLGPNQALTFSKRDGNMDLEFTIDINPSKSSCTVLNRDFTN